MRIKAVEAFNRSCPILKNRIKSATSRSSKESVDSSREVWIQYGGLRSGRVLIKSLSRQNSIPRRHIAVVAHTPQPKACRE